jgi:carboxyl-terminal processing protease
MISALSHPQQLNGNKLRWSKHYYLRRVHNKVNILYKLIKKEMKRIVFGYLFAVVILVFQSSAATGQTLNDGAFKFGRTLALIDAFYVDTVNLSALTEKAIVEALRSLDPHSSYISAKDVKEMNEPLNGNFEGIGIQFNVLHDSIVVIEPTPHGPSEKVGLLAGDRIVRINDEKVSGIKISTTGVRSRLMGPKGTKVNLSVFRKGNNDLLAFTITRDKIPIFSLDASYMINNETGYIRLNKFAATTEKEFKDALLGFQNSGLRNIILDLRNNGGGYMLAAVAIANQFLDGEKLVVYMEGRKTPREEYKSSGNGALTKAKLVILTDEGSASASEILAGAMQDWDRGVIIGRRSFGKGLVQNGFYLTDGSQIRLTIARYYTPAGRSIQSPYNEGYDKYYANFLKRYTDGEMMNADSIHFPDSLKYNTKINHRTVYGGGGIMPDVFVAADTSNYSDYYRDLGRKGVYNSFTLEYADKNRLTLKSLYPKFEDFKSKFTFTAEDVKNFIATGEAAGVKYNEKQFDVSKKEILQILKALVASDIWNTTEYFRIINEDDVVIARAMKILADDKQYRKLLGN